MNINHPQINSGDLDSRNEMLTEHLIAFLERKFETIKQNEVNISTKFSHLKTQFILHGDLVFPELVNLASESLGISIKDLLLEFNTNLNIVKRFLMKPNLL